MPAQPESKTPGTLYVVATPIGHLDDFSLRARAVLAAVDVIAAEDTRHTARLLSHYRIGTRQLPLHDHNEASVAPRIISQLLEGGDVALVSDAGTPLISDPGYTLVRRARAEGIRVTPIPGASALLAALSVCGLATDRFTFEGFLPSRASARRRRIAELEFETRTLVFYESPHRITATLDDLASAFGSQRQAVLARELTKVHEEVLSGGLQELSAILRSRDGRVRGELVIVVAGTQTDTPSTEGGVDPHRLLARLVQELPVKQAAVIVAELSGLRKNALYQEALELSRREQ